MTLDPKIAEAIGLAVIDAKQDKVLGDKIIAWMNALTSGNEGINDEQSAKRHLELLFETTVTSESRALNAPRRVTLRDGSAQRLFSDEGSDA